MWAAAQIVDEAAGEAVLVFGSPPPHGRDLDLLARPAAARAIAAALAAAGFQRRGSQWVRFAGGTVAVVDLVEAAEWRLPAGELADLYAAARPLEGATNLVVPGPEHQLLILATRLGGARSLSAGRRVRAAAAAGEPGAWDRARARVGKWGRPRDLDALRAALAGDAGPGALRRVNRALRGARRPRVIALSGVDGSGKSTQARTLRDALVALGHDAEIVWNPLASDRWVARLGDTVKAAIAGMTPRRSTAGDAADGPDAQEDPGRALRERSSAVNAAWSTLVALANGISHARLVTSHARAGRVVIFDRYVLDSLVRARLFYGEHARLGLQRALVRLLSPEPLLAILLDVDAEVSLARKDDLWTREQIFAQVRLYREEHEALGVLRLDGTRPPAELADQLAELAWRRLA